MDKPVDHTEARRQGGSYLEEFMQGKWKSWEEAMNKNALDRGALEHLSMACLSDRDRDCDELLGLMQRTGYLTRDQLRYFCADELSRWLSGAGGGSTARIS